MLRLWPYCRTYLFIAGLLLFPLIGHAYVIYDETNKMLNINDIADYPRLNKMILPYQKITCDPSKSACSGDVMLEVYANEKARKPLCGYNVKLKNEQGKPDVFMITQMENKPARQKGWCKIEYYHGLEHVV